MRRIIKPFTVEVKTSARRATQRTQPVWPQDTEQPHVEWPKELLGRDAELVDAIHAAPAKPGGRVLPDLNEASDPLGADRVGLPKPDTAEHVRPTEPEAAGDPYLEPVSQATAFPDPEPITPHVGIDGSAVSNQSRQGRKRLAREDFSRSERWKARLPAAAHRKRR